MKVRDLMSTDVKFCRPETNLTEAVKLMEKRDCGVLPVVAVNGTVSGVITDRDVCIAMTTRGLTGDRIAVREVTAGHCYTCSPDDDAVAALQTMKTHKVRRLPVVDPEGRLAGILSINDVLTHADAVSHAEIVATMASICEHSQSAIRGRPVLA
jgi:CBS domain-containing protein